MTPTVTTPEIKYLRMIASRLAEVSGGGQAYRCGGEEFAILFPGKTTGDVVEHLEKLRAEIEGSTLRLRGPDRRQEARGPDRRNQRPRGRAQTGHAIRQLSRAAPSDQLSVTASIGVATSRRENPSAEEVIQAADKALYRAKAAGRNRIETASAPRSAGSQQDGRASRERKPIPDQKRGARIVTSGREHDARARTFSQAPQAVRSARGRRGDGISPSAAGAGRDTSRG